MGPQVPQRGVKSVLVGVGGGIGQYPRGVVDSRCAHAMLLVFVAAEPPRARSHGTLWLRADRTSSSPPDGPAGRGADAGIVRPPRDAGPVGRDGPHTRADVVGSRAWRLRRRPSTVRRDTVRRASGRRAAMASTAAAGLMASG